MDKSKYTGTTMVDLLSIEEEVKDSKKEELDDSIVMAEKEGNQASNTHNEEYEEEMEEYEEEMEEDAELEELSGSGGDDDEARRKKKELLTVIGIFAGIFIALAGVGYYLFAPESSDNDLQYEMQIEETQEVPIQQSQKAREEVLPREEVVAQVQSTVQPQVAEVAVAPTTVVEPDQIADEAKAVSINTQEIIEKAKKEKIIKTSTCSFISGRIPINEFYVSDGKAFIGENIISEPTLVVEVEKYKAPLYGKKTDFYKVQKLDIFVSRGQLIDTYNCSN